MATSRTKIPDLPFDKEFHCFVCYASENRKTVEEIVGNLEKEGVKCNFYERDFKPGTVILDNINGAIRKSMHMLVILSNDIENRGYCKHEIRQALTEKINENYSIIPIKIEPCKIPDDLRHIIYIDAENEVKSNMHHRIIDALISGSFL